MVDSLDLFAQYLKERSNTELIKHHHGFATYRQIAPDTVYLIDIYVVPEQRRNGIATELSALVAQKAKELGAKRLLGSVDITANGVTESLNAVLGDGFRYSHANGSGLFFVKDL